MKRSNNMLLRVCVTNLRLVVLCLVWFAGNVCFVRGATVPSEEAIDKLAMAPGTRRLCLSLSVLSKQVTEALADKSALSDEIRNLCGIGYLEGFIVDESGDKDIILVGCQSKERPSLYLDDLIVNMRNVGLSEQFPYRSLDPRSEDILALNKLFNLERTLKSQEEKDAFFTKLVSTVGPQQVVVGGVPRNSRHAHVMIDADYHMKKVSQGHVEVPGVTSSLDRSLDEAKKAILDGAASADEGVSMARFWFHIDPCETNDSNYP